MNIPKIKKGINAYLPVVLDIVKAGAIEKQIGACRCYISIRLHKHKNGPYSIRSFKQNDVDNINKGMQLLGDKLIKTNIAYTGDRITDILSLKEALSDVFITKLIESALGYDQAAILNRTTIGKTCHNRKRFTEEEFEKITMAVRQVGMMLLSIEFYLDE